VTVYRQNPVLTWVACVKLSRRNTRRWHKILVAAITSTRAVHSPACSATTMTGWKVFPKASIASFAGTGNPFRISQLQFRERVVDIGSGAGIDSLIAAKMVGPDGQVIGVDMTPAMLEMARKSASEAG